MALAGPTNRSRTTSTTTAGHTASGFVGGGQIGCDYQIGAFLFGIQGTGEWTNAHGSNTWLLGGNVNTTDVRWFSTLTGRIGFVQTASFLIYGKGGGAWAGDQHQITNAAGTVLWTANPTRGGWTAGVGLEWMFAPNWSTFIEYDYLGFGSSTFAFTPAAGGVYLPISVKQNINMVLVGSELPLRPAGRCGRAALLRAGFIAHEKSPGPPARGSSFAGAYVPGLAPVGRR